jgi:putative heme-binding domain-containing protein
VRVVLFLLPFAILAQSSEAELGKAAFRVYCTPCHGRNAEGGRGPDLTTGNYAAGDRDEDLARVIANGVPGSEMRAYKTNINAENINRLVAFIRSQAKPDAQAAAGDPALGEKVFWSKAACGGCHRVGTRGGNFGPDLTRIGRMRSAAHLRESILDPDASQPPGYESMTVVTKDGKKITGRSAGLDTFSARLFEANGAYHSFFIDDLKSVSNRQASLMPSYRGRLSDAEVDGLVAYMISLRGDSR